MRGAYISYLKTNGIGRYTDAVEAIKKEDAERRRARIMNGAEPSHQNGHPKDQEKGRSVPKKKKGGRKGY
jgi:hypothetical protein